MSEYIDLEIQKWAERLAHGTLSEVADALVFYKQFRKKLAQEPQLLGLMGYWKEAMVKSLRNPHVSPAYMEEIIQILVTDFSEVEVNGELITYFEKITLPQQVELLHALQTNVSEKFSDVILQLEETIANTPKKFKTFNLKH